VGDFDPATGGGFSSGHRGKNCLEKFKKRPEKYVKEQENQGVIFEATPSVIPKN